MPGPVTHIYTARRVADFLNSRQVTENFIRPDDGNLDDGQQLKYSDLLRQLGPKQCAQVMSTWEKFTAVGAIGPDLFFWLQDYNQSYIPSDSIMLAMSLLYYLDDQGRLDDPYEGLLIILAEVTDTWASILRFLIKLNQIWQKFVKWYQETIGPILDKVDEVIDDLTGGLLTALGDALTQLKNDLLEFLEAEALTEGDIFGLFSLKMRDGFDEKAFVWSDMTHYRRTNTVPSQMIVKAQKMLAADDTVTKQHGEQLLAFALGWICHVGTDVIEHSFVNEQCGGPFRTHWQRHHLIENHIDAWNYKCTKDDTLPADDFCGWKDTYPSIADSALYFAVQIPQDIDDPDKVNLPPSEKQGDHRQPLPAGGTREGDGDRKKLLDTDGALPLWLCETIVEVFVEVYADPSEGGNGKLQATWAEEHAPHPLNLKGSAFKDDILGPENLLAFWLDKLGVDNAGIALDDLRKVIAPDLPDSIPNLPAGFPFPWEIAAAYRFMLSWFKRQYLSTLDIDKPEPPKIFTPPASDFDFGPPDFSGVGKNDDPVSKTCETLAALFDWLFKTIEKAAQLLYDLAKSALSAATILPRAGIYYGVTLPLWQISENLRLVLVYLGYALPQSEELWPSGNIKRPNEIDMGLITLGHTVDGEFQNALAAASDILGNIDSDPSLNNVGIRNPVLGDNNPWLPVRLTKGLPGTTFPFVKKDGVVEFLRPWAFPNQTNDTNPAKKGNYLETPLTTAGPYDTNTLPHTLLMTTEPISNHARKLYELACTPADTDALSTAFVLHHTDTNTHGEQGFPGTNPLGDPVVFSTYLIGQLLHNPQFLSSFNLDADRGYGYLCWDWDRNPELQDADGRGNKYNVPVVPNEGMAGRMITPWIPPDPTTVGNNKYKPELKLHYTRICKKSLPENPSEKPPNPPEEQPR